MDTIHHSPLSNSTTPTRGRDSHPVPLDGGSADPPYSGHTGPTIPYSTRLYLLIVLFGMNIHLATNSLWIQLPAMAPDSPERGKLPGYFIVIYECSNLAALAYLLVKRYTSQSLSEVPFIYCSYALSLTSLLLAAMFWQTTTKLPDSQHSFVLLACVLLAALVSSSSTITYIMFCGNLRPVYITAVLMGDVMGAFVPHIVALGQGMSEHPNCAVPKIIPKQNSTVLTVNQIGAGPSTTPRPLYPPQIRFDEKFFFFAIAAIQCISAIAFIAVRYFSKRTGYIHDGIFTVEDEVWQNHGESSRDRYQLDGYVSSGGVRPRDGNGPGHSCNTGRGNYILDDGSILHNEDRKHFYSEATCSHHHHQHHNHHHHHHNCTRYQGRGQRLNSQESQGQSSVVSQLSGFSNPRSSLLCSSSVDSQSSTAKHLHTSRPRNFPLLIAITVWATCVNDGPLSTVKAHACYPLGNNYFLSGVIAVNFFKAINCPFSLKLYPRSRITVIVALTALATITLAYFAALIGFNIKMGSLDSTIFRSTGELLGTFAWATVVGLFSLALSTIGAVCAEAGRNYLTWYSVAFQLGNSLGNLFLIDRNNIMGICEIYKNVEGC